ncbi:hypothetical protein JAAARDRAFT_119276 [Jaapia argillacea MUCL 33604]|uniref:Uncharacterized protein n=1 Tax=Jaapia argillacea MUCL 33604 TaxID=933084 RepID=A0A067Q969_9AGAM|nr:hypothetical protein JAAARDRAFT_119276 [Jaapia argillacea MUCL 33604]
MFPPFDILAASGKTIDDLEKNSQIAPTWRNRDSILSGLVSIVLGITGSSAVATFYSLQGLMNTLQIFALILNTIVPRAGLNISATWKNLFLGKIPNILALNFASTMTESIVYLLIFMAVACILLYLFHRATAESAQISVIEGLQRPTKPSSGWGIVIVSFLLTVIYLPLSTMAVHVLVWSQDLWAVPNPYINATTSPPQVVPLGPSDEYRDPLDFCWATTMKRNEVNWAPALFIIAAIIVGLLTVWFPIRLRQLIKQSVPIVDPYTELGRLRTKPDMDREYSRLLARDTNPFSFLYSGFRRGWATYEAVYLFAKFSTLLVVAVVDPNNCLFRTLSSTKVTIARQFLLVIVASFFFVLQCFLGPFLDPINNASEWTSRLNYVLTAAVALGVAYNIPGSSILDGVILYIIYGVTYGLSVYFLIINMSIMHRTVKRLARRIDFSIDIFSPRQVFQIDLSHSSPHTKRRIWQETISALFLTSPECRIPKKQPMYFVQARDSEYPPYLMDFCGTPAERHVENLKILREVGSADYLEAVALVSGLEHEWFRHLEKEIQERFVGPDCYWKSPHERSIPGCTKYFGNAWWIPFPPTLVLRYDDGPLAVIRSVEDLEAYVVQNSSVQIRRRREVRMALRALDGQRVLWPYKLTQSVGAHHSCCRGRRYNARTTTYYQTGVLQIKHHGHLVWESTQLGSGFDVQLEYAKTANVDGGVFGLNDDYDLTAPLARFLALNHELIPQRLAHLEGVLFRYRQHHRRECLTKSRVLTYRFLTRVYDRPREPSGLAETSIEFESDLRVRQLMVGNEDVFRSSFERMSYVSTSEMATWWFLFWDDLWRRNHDTISALPLYASDFNPYYPTSIAYTPLPRPALEAFLTQRGMLHKPSKWGDFFHSGFLNRMYLRMNEVAFKGSSRVIWLHLGHNVSELDMEDVDIQTQARSSTLGTGGGTDHDDASIRPRPTFRWEGILADPIRQGKRHRNLFAKFEAWFGLTPLWRSGTPSNGVSLDVVLENGRYLVLNPDGSTSLSGSDLKV